MACSPSLVTRRCTHWRPRSCATSASCCTSTTGWQSSSQVVSTKSAGWTDMRMTTAQVRALLRRRTEEAGGVAAFARAHGLHASHVSGTMNACRGHQETITSDPLLQALGLRRVVMYERRE